MRSDEVPFGGFFRRFLWRQRNRPAGGDGTTERKADANGESVEDWRLVRYGGDESKTRDISLLRERPSFAARRKKAKARQRGPISRRSPLDSLPDDQGGCGPHWIPWGLRGTKDGGLDGSYGLPQPLRGFAMTGAGAGRPLLCPSVSKWKKIILGFLLTITRLCGMLRERLGGIEPGRKRGKGGMCHEKGSAGEHSGL